LSLEAAGAGNAVQSRIDSDKVVAVLGLSFLNSHAGTRRQLPLFVSRIIVYGRENLIESAGYFTRKRRAAHLCPLIQ